MGWNPVPYFEYQEKSIETVIDYTIKDFPSKTYGKIPESNAKNQLMMEFEYWIPTWANHTDFSYWMDEETEV